MLKTLVIGCGNIGAQYDLNSTEIQTHTKAWHLNPETTVTIYDINKELALKVSDKYQCNIANDIEIDTLSGFDIVSICSPTFTHKQLLTNAISAKVKTIICEKPISNDREELAILKKLYLAGSSKILVNYIRRFQPAYDELKQTIDTLLNDDVLTNINIRYQRGFINNCSHAMDLIEFLFHSSVELENIKTHNKIFDHFKDDATLSLQADWKDANINVLGLSNVLFSNFEIDIYLKKYKIAIKNAGDSLEFFKAGKEGLFLQPLTPQPELNKKNCLKNYMQFVTDYALKLTRDPGLEDNFNSAIELNQKMLNYKNN